MNSEDAERYAADLIERLRSITEEATTFAGELTDDDSAVNGINNWFLAHGIDPQYVRIAVCVATEMFEPVDADPVSRNGVAMYGFLLGFDIGRSMVMAPLRKE